MSVLDNALLLYGLQYNFTILHDMAILNYIIWLYYAVVYIILHTGGDMERQSGQAVY